MSDNDHPPLKRLRLNLEVDAHDLNELWHTLRLIANDLDHDGQEERTTVSSGGWHLTLRVQNPEPYTPEEYEQRLIDWMHHRRAAHKASVAASRSSSPTEGQ